MAKKAIEESAAAFARPIAEKHDFELVDTEFVKEGANWYLRVYIDKPGGVTLDDCQAVSEELSEKLDETDPIKQSYYLEVSSPGLERPLKTERDFEKYRGETVELKLFQPVNGKKVLEGELLGLVEGRIGIKQGEEELYFEKESVSTVRRTIKF